MSSDNQLKATEQAIKQAWEEGCPVAAHHQEWSHIAVRRWNSSHRRGIKPSDGNRRTEDLAKGLIQRFEKNPKAVGRLAEDYRYLARKIAHALEAAVDQDDQSD